MKYSKLIIIVTISFLSCSKNLVMNNSECKIDQKQINNILKYKHSKLKKYEIRKGYDENLNVDCNGLFFLIVKKKKNVKTMYVDVPFLKIGNKYFVNLKSNSDCSESQKDFNEFKENALNMGFSLNTLNEIEIIYKRGVNTYNYSIHPHFW